MWTAFSEDVPRSESTEPEVFTAERVMNMMADQHAKQWDDTTGVIRYQGKPVGYSSVSFKLGGRVGYQEGTWVDRVHRGKGLSLHAKVANYLMILEEDILDEIQTENAEDNRAMWAVNEKLGFQISSSEGDWTCRYDNGVWGPI